MLIDFEPGDYVVNPANKSWGIGQVQSIIGNKVTVNFENYGKRVINVENVNLEKLNDYILHSELHITTHIDTESIAELMYKADLAIGAGGSTAWERCALALPTLVISLAENQSQIINTLAKINAVVNIGSSKDVTVRKRSDALNNVIENPFLLKEMQLRSSDVCDAEGTKRISSELLTAFGN